MKGTGSQRGPYTFSITNSARQLGKLVPSSQKVQCVLVFGTPSCVLSQTCTDSALHQVEYPDGSENPVTINVIVIA